MISLLYTTLHHHLIKGNLTKLIEYTFNREGSLYLACNEKRTLFTSDIICGHDALHYLLDNTFKKLYLQIVGIPMGTNCTPLVADLFSFCYA